MSANRLRPLIVLPLLLLLATAARAGDDAPDAPGAPTASPAVPAKVTQGQELSAADERAVRDALSRYLEAMKHRKWRAAGELVERKSFDASCDAMIRGVSTDPQQEGEARRKFFGVATRGEFDRLSTPEAFERLMNTLEAINPESGDMLARAELELMGARRFKDKVHVAYQLTIPGEGPDGAPVTHVTAEQLAKVDGKWKILFRLDK